MSKTDNAEDNFLGRWSRRKQQSKIEQTDSVQTGLPNEESPPTQKPQPDHDAEAAEFPLAEPSADEESAGEEKVLTDEDMVPIESLNADSDYSPFFSEGVSKQLRNMALKKLFFSGKFAARDGLDDYDDDFTRFEPLGNTVTSDMKFHQRRKEKARLAKLEEERLEEERLLAAEEAEQNADSREALETSEADNEAADAEEVSGNDLIDDSGEAPHQEDQSDTLIELADVASAAEKPPEAHDPLQNADRVVAGQQARLEQKDPQHRTTQTSADDSNNPNRENS